MPPRCHADTVKTDLKREISVYTALRGGFKIVTVPPQRFLAIEGSEDPNTSAAYRDAVASLYPLAYAGKALSRRESGRDFVVMPLEAPWSAADMAAYTTARDKSRWDWTLLLAQPDWIDEAQVDEARAEVRRKNRAPRLDAVRLERLAEGLCAQRLHIGPYAYRRSLFSRTRMLTWMGEPSKP